MAETITQTLKKYYKTFSDISDLDEACPGFLNFYKKEVMAKYRPASNFDIAKKFIKDNMKKLDDKLAENDVMMLMDKESKVVTNASAKIKNLKRELNAALANKLKGKDRKNLIEEQRTKNNQFKIEKALEFIKFEDIEDKRVQETCKESIIDDIIERRITDIGLSFYGDTFTIAVKGNVRYSDYLANSIKQYIVKNTKQNKESRARLSEEDEEKKRSLKLSPDDKANIKKRFLKIKSEILCAQTQIGRKFKPDSQQETKKSSKKTKK